MKICPTCRKTYHDDGLNFCLEDGTVLAVAGVDAPPTVMMQSPPPTSPSSGVVPPPVTQPSWEKPAQYSMQPKKTSKSWLWVVGLLGVGALLCGGGVIGVAFLIYYAPADVASNSTSNTTKGNTSNTAIFGNSKSASPTALPVNDGRTTLETIEFEGWVQEDSAYGNTEYTGGELIMSAKRKGYYYVLVAQREYVTEDANTRLAVRNMDNADSSMGYGLVFHSNPTPLQQGYAFLIDAKKKRYRVVRHVPQDEPVVVKWTNSAAIRDGTQENVLEARDNNGSVDLYINDEKVTSIKNTYGFKDGVPGVYSGDGVRTAFSKLEIRK